MINFPSVGWHNPISEMERMFQQMDLLARTMFGRPGRRGNSSRVFPAVNVSEDTDTYFVRAELPGIKAEDVELQVKGRHLSISGDRNIPSEGDNVKYHRKERESGKFSKVIGLPGDIDAESVDAKMVNGLLVVRIAKSDAAKPKRISVN
jgi:HSP20 family protein